MFRIDSSGATADNRFTEGSASEGVAATKVSDSWLNSVQEEIANAIEGGGVALDKTKENQLATLLAAMRGAKVDKFTLTAAGNIMVAGADGNKVSDSGTSLATVLGWFTSAVSGIIKKAFGLSVIQVASGASVQASILSNIGANKFYSVIGATTTPEGTGTVPYVYSVDWIDASTLTCRVTAKGVGSLSQFDIRCSAGTWDAKWTPIANNAGVIVYSSHQLSPSYMEGTYTYDTIAAAFTTLLGAGPWSAGVNGWYYYGTTYFFVERIYSDGTNIFMRATGGVLQLNGSSTSAVWNISF